MKILGFIIGAGMLLGIIGFFLWMLSIIFSRNPFGGLYLPWMPWLGGGGNYTIKCKITINGKGEVPQETSTDYNPMNQPLRIAPHHKPKLTKKKKQKPEWWRFLTEESIGSLLEKRRKRKAEAEARKTDPLKNMR